MGQSVSLAVERENVERTDVQKVSTEHPNNDSSIPPCTRLGTTDGRIDEQHAKQQRHAPDKSIGHN
jgi:hypothetical protein